MMFEKNKLAILFGAGAEQSLGLPNGGEFAISLFTQKYDSLRLELRQALDTITNKQSNNSNYIEWLNYTSSSTNRISTFGKYDFEQVIMSSAEQKKQDIKAFLIHIDDNACSLCKKLIGDKSLTKNTVYEDLKKKLNLGDLNEEPIVKFSESLSGKKDYESFSDQNEYDGFLKSNTISLIIHTLSQAKSKQLEIDTSQHEILQECFRVLLFMIVITFGDDLLKNLNRGIFTSENETTHDYLALFEEMFTMKYDRAAGIIYDFIQKQRPAFEDCPDKVVERFINLIHRLTFNLCSTSIDYQMLVDNYFRYIMSPKTDWAKFTKMFLFLRAAYDAITSKEHTLSDEALKKNNSYYHDIIEELKEDNASVEIKALASTNYHDYYGRLVKLRNESKTEDGTLDEASLEARFGKVMRLNGGVGEFYNPYKNSLVKREPVNTAAKQDHGDNLFLYQNQLVTPFFFTQSGIKPITAIDVSCLYTEMYSKFKEADIIVVIGFNFNSDDNHINTIIRDLVENHNKTLVLITVDADTKDALKTKKEEVCKKLRIDPTEAQDRVKVLNVDSDSRVITSIQGNSDLWLDYLAKLKINNELSH